MAPRTVVAQGESLITEGEDWDDSSLCVIIVVDWSVSMWWPRPYMSRFDVGGVIASDNDADDEDEEEEEEDFVSSGNICFGAQSKVKSAVLSLSFTV